MAIDLGALESVIARDISEIADLPDFKPPPAGVYALLIEDISTKEIAEKTALQVTYVVDTIIEQVSTEIDPKDQVIPGNKFSEAFFFDKVENLDMTLGSLKKKFAPLAEHLGTTNLKGILEGAVGLKIMCNIKNRVNKKTSPPSIYASVNDVVLATS